ncbi:MAG: hypothetical protein SVE93_06130 [Candidatus Thermoplasmatota archaeon]|nr:hypothetical protein [Candidatus Thermoplasmatota archaeon]
MNEMRTLLAVGIAALLLGLVLSAPLRVNALEEKENMVEGAVTQLRRVNPVTNGLLGAMGLGPLAALLCFVVGILMMLFGWAFIIAIITAPLGISLLILSLIFMFVLPVLCLIIGSPIGFILGFGEGIATIPYDIGDFIIRLIDAITPW